PCAIAMPGQMYDPRVSFGGSIIESQVDAVGGRRPHTNDRLFPGVEGPERLGRNDAVGRVDMFETINGLRSEFCSCHLSVFFACVFFLFFSRCRSSKRRGLRP